MYRLKNKWFSKWAKKAKITDKKLGDAINDFENDKSAISLGGNLYKLRVSKPGQGKSGSYRTLIAYKKGSRLIFLYGFAKNEKDNIDRDELVLFKKYAKDLIKLNREQLEVLIGKNELVKIKEEKQ